MITGTGVIPPKETLVADPKGELSGHGVFIEAMPSTRISFETE